MRGLRDAFITGTGAFLPGEPVTNDRMEDFIGRIGGRKSATGKRALRWNGIGTRHYALTPKGEPLYSNASMSAAAVMAALGDAGLGRESLQFLATATTQGDLLVPGHGSAVHGELGGLALELASFQSVCVSSLMAAEGTARAQSSSSRSGDATARISGSNGSI
jgi:3-oxoacyl-[acyl-carrier-protein] synthase III